MHDLVGSKIKVQPILENQVISFWGSNELNVPIILASAKSGNPMKPSKFSRLPFSKILRGYGNIWPGVTLPVGPL